MAITKRFLSAVSVSGILIILTSGRLAFAQEKILNFNSFIEINTNGSLTVTETIIVNAEGYEIKHGIYRDFPTKYKENNGLNYNTSFKVLDVLKNGQKENYHTEKLSNGTRLYIGNADVYLDKGIYTYTIVYKTDRQLGYYKDFDELYYNVTGNGWEFTIDDALANVQLPSGVTVDQVKINAYTGSTGDTGVKYFGDVYLDRGRANAVFKTNSPLYANQGLTIVVEWPKGFVTEPSAIEKTIRMVIDNITIFLSVDLVILTGLYYLVIWLKHGRDPKGTGTIVPQFGVEKGISPAGARYIHKMAFDNNAMAASLVSMAIKGYLKINEATKIFSIELTGQDTIKLTEEEKLLAQKFFEKGNKTFAFSTSRADKISTVIEEFQESLKKTYLGKYFSNNGKFLVPPILATTLLIAIAWISESINIWSIGGASIIIALTIAGAVAIKARTVLGRKIEDQILGLKEYLTAVEKPRYASKINLETPDNLKVYEKYLPYAIALDVEPIWTGRFKKQIDAAQIIDKDGKLNTYWYHGASLYNTTALTGSLGKAFASSISSSSVKPGSHSGFSGGGGGGFSGGGGGGGGGGGW